MIAAASPSTSFPLADVDVAMRPVSKRFVDLLLAVLFLPLLICIGAMLLVVNPFCNVGPLMFRQTRIGQHGVPFVIYKFRTMQGCAQGAKFATQEAARLAPFGRFLRRHRVDELPQIINVLRGEMSFVGPRPEQPAFDHFYANVISGYCDRRALRPGITGLSQICIGYTDTTIGAKRKLACDRIYGRRAGTVLDCYVICRTIGVIISGRGGV